MREKSESGLSRWARRKAAARDDRTAAAPKRGAALPAAPAAADAQLKAPAAEENRSDRESDATGHRGTEAPANLPDIETLDYDSDYAGFLSEDVSDAVRNVALRKLWRSNPLLANVDGLVDYDDDFTDAATVIEGMKSVYRVGRGMVEDEPEGMEEATASTASDAEELQDDVSEPSASDDETDTVVAQQDTEPQSAEADASQDTVAKDTDGKKTGDTT